MVSVLILLPVAIVHVCVHRKSFIESCRDFKGLFQETREKAAKGLGFAKMLRKVKGVAMAGQGMAPKEKRMPT